MSGSADKGAGDDLTEKLLDLLVYAPIGLVLDAQALAPDLARRGRQHTAAARQLGELAVKRGLRRFDDTATPSESGSAPKRTAATSARSAGGAHNTAAMPDKREPEAAAKAKKKPPTRKATSKKAVTKKAVTKKAVTKKAVTKKAVTKKKVAASKASSTKAPAKEVAERPPKATVDAESLAIPEYDLLAASQVVKRLDALSAEELEAVRRYESATRDRRTILHKVARLQA